MIIGLAIGLALGITGSWFVFGLISAARIRDEAEEQTYDEMRPPAWVSETSPALVAIPHAIQYGEGVAVTKFEDSDHDATVYRFKARSGL